MNVTRMKSTLRFFPVALFAVGLRRCVKPLACTFVTLALIALTVRSSGQDHIYLDHFHTPNGLVRTVQYAPELNTVFIGGTFDAVGPFQPFGARVDVSGGQEIPLSCGRFLGEVFAAVADENGGWFVGGSFTHIGDSARQHLAHIDNTGQLTAWNPGADDDVTVLELYNGVLYASGQFDVLGGAPRNRIGAIDAESGDVLDWSPVMNDAASDFAVVDTTLYVVGYFSNVNGQPQNSAAFSLNSGELLDWNPGMSGGIAFAIEANDSIVFLGGNFSQIAGVSEFRLAKVSRLTGELLTFTNANNTIRTMKLAGDTLFLAGDFTSYTSVQRAGLAAVNASTGQLLDWAPAVNEDVRSFVVSANEVFIGGQFTSVSGQERLRAAALDRFSGELLPWSPMLSDDVNCITRSGDYFFVGGEFEVVGAKTRHNVAALDVTTGEVTDWFVNANDHVYDLELKGDTLFLAGEFYNVQGVSKTRIACVSASTGQLIDWTSELATNVYRVYDMALSDDAIYLCAWFSVNNSTPRPWLQKFDIATGDRIEWNATVMSTPQCILVDGDVVYVGGAFHSANNTTRERLAAFDATTGELTPWHPVNVSAYVSELHVHEDNVYANGGVSPTWSLLSRFDNELGISEDWTNHVLYDCDGITSSGNTLYVAGTEVDANGEVLIYQSENTLWAIDIPSGAVTGFAPFRTGLVSTLLAENDTLFVGGSFVYKLPFARPSFMVFVDPCVAAETPNPIASDSTPCYGYEVELSVGDASLEDAAQWSWYANACGTNLIGTGPSISVTPDSTTTYFVRAEGGCPEQAGCSSIALEPQAQITGVEEQQACGSFVWLDGVVYTESTTTPQFNVIGGASTGCDSLLTLHLTIFGGIDECGECFALGNEDPGWNQSCSDCAGTPYGVAFLDNCGNCVGGTTQLTPCSGCLADANGDGWVSLLDLGLMMSEFGCASDCSFDFNSDGVVGTDDLMVFLQEYGYYCN